MRRRDFLGLAGRVATGVVLLALAPRTEAVEADEHAPSSIYLPETQTITINQYRYAAVSIEDLEEAYRASAVVPPSLPWYLDESIPGGRVSFAEAGPAV